MLVADVYGKGVRPKNDAEAMAQVKQLYADRSVLRARADKALEVLQGAGRRRAAGCHAASARSGYCFGGATVLELARSGADIAGVVSFHGGLATSMPAQARRGQGQPARAQWRRRHEHGAGRHRRRSRRKWTQPASTGSSSISAARCIASRCENANTPPGCVYNRTRGEARVRDDATTSSRERFAAR